jgi:hypothetical protein
MFTTHAPVPVQSPDQPAKRELTPAAGVRVTFVPWSNVAEQVPPQSIPDGELVTVPDPAPDLVTFIVQTVVKVAVTV